MDLIDRLRELSANVSKKVDHLKTEEATKTALVLPFIGALGYNVFDPAEVVPEFTADVGTKKGEKVDYAILHEGEPIILFECKTAGADLDRGHASQLYRYFNVTPARFGVLTNGLSYRVYTDLEAPNRMDSRPFLEFDVSEIDESTVNELKKFAKGTFDLEEILSTASELKYTKGIKRVLAEEWVNPSQDFVKLLAGRVYSGRLTSAVKEQFAEIAKRAFQQFVHERVDERLKKALDREAPSASSQARDDDDIEEESEPKAVATTEEEIEAYYVVKSIVGELVDLDRVFMRDTKSYCGILLDDNNRKPICRLWLDGSRRHIGIFDEKKEVSRHSISNLNDIYKHAEVLKATVARHSPKSE